MSKPARREHQVAPNKQSQVTNLSQPEVELGRDDATGPSLEFSLQAARQPRGPLKPAEVLRLQQTLGNQAVQRLLAQRSQPDAAVVQREIMTLAQFQTRTSITGSRRSKIKQVDNALDELHKKGELFGKTGQYLTMLLDSIETWLQSVKAEKKNGRRAGVLELKKQVEAEQAQASDQTVAGPPKAKPTSEEAGNVVAPGEHTTYDDFDGKQYRIYGRKPNRIIEEVKRKTVGKKIVYFAMGQVVDFQTAMPVVRYYAKPVSLGEWYPKVTHLNGMNTVPQSGLDSALALQESINLSLDQNMGEEGLALGQDVLYTYSAQRGNGASGFAADVFDCIKGKVGVADTVTKSQTQLMLDAVATKQRTTISAHSRGTIKTDNAVREVYNTLVERYSVTTRKDPAVLKKAREVASQIAETGGMFDEDTAYALALAGQVQQAADRQAREDMDKYIQLIYAGNAVSYPSSVLPIEMFVGSTDAISLAVGTYTKTGAKIASGNSKTKLNKQAGGHGFTDNYAGPVGQSIAKDLQGR